jgi:hypothetical protein
LAEFDEYMTNSRIFNRVIDDVIAMLYVRRIYIILIKVFTLLVSVVPELQTAHGRGD